MKLKFTQLQYRGDPVDAFSLECHLLIQDNPMNPIAGAFFDYDDAIFNFDFAKECGVTLQPLSTRVVVTPNSLPKLYNLIKEQKNV